MIAPEMSLCDRSISVPDGNIDFYQYPWLSLGAYLVTGVDAANGDLFEGNGTVELLIVADVSA
jgi:hypothetical protein